MKNTWIFIIIIIIIAVIVIILNRTPSVGEPLNSTRTETGVSPLDNNLPATPPVTTSPTTGGSTNTGTPKVVSFTVRGGSFFFNPSTMKVKLGDTVNITFINEGGTHDLKIDEYNVATKILASAAQETVSFVATKKGSFEYYCSMSSHRQAGMKGTLTVE